MNTGLMSGNETGIEGKEKPGSKAGMVKTGETRKKQPSIIGQIFGEETITETYETMTPEQARKYERNKLRSQGLDILKKEKELRKKIKEYKEEESLIAEADKRFGFEPEPEEPGTDSSDKPGGTTA